MVNMSQTSMECHRSIMSILMFLVCLRLLFRRRSVNASLKKMKSYLKSFFINLLNIIINMCHFDTLIKLLSVDNDCMFHFIFDVIYRKPCFLHIKSARKVMSTTFSEISVKIFESLNSFSVAPPPLPTLPEIDLPKAASLHCVPLPVIIAQSLLHSVGQETLERKRIFLC